jgi:hypothetical protein
LSTSSPTPNPAKEKSTSPWEWHLTESFKALAPLATELLKALALVNGGGAVALLTYLGNLISHTAPKHSPNIKWALISYCFGLSCTVAAFGVAYLTQLRLYQEERARHLGEAFRTLHQWGIRAGLFLVVLSIAAFGAGCWLAASALEKIGAP